MKPKLFIFFLPLLFVITGCNQVIEQEPSTEKPFESPILDFPNHSTKQNNSKRSPLMISKDFGKTWLPFAQELPKDLQVSFLEQKGTELVVASDNRGMFISKANKSTWRSISDQLPDTKINALHVSGNTIYAGVFRKGIYYTINEGQSWLALNFDLPDLNVQSILNTNEQLFVGTDIGIFRFLDEEQKWQSTNIQAQTLSIYSYDNKLVAGTSQGTARSDDRGKTWKWIQQKEAVHYTHPIGSRVIELVLNGDLSYSDDWGQTWESIQYQPRAGSYVYEIIQVGKYQLFSNNYGIHQSEDAGKTWKLIFETEAMAFFDLIAIGKDVYGGTRAWDEYRKRNK